jgi:hypothetical protein
VLALVLVFSGCAQTDTDLAADSAGRLQSLVVSVAQVAATGDYTSAIAELDALQAELDASRGRGDVSEERAASIQAAIDAVRADLQQAAEPASPSAPAEEIGDAPASEAPAVPAPEKTNSGREDGGPGRGNGGNGNGNGGGRDR